jgi:transposase-like protein
VRSKGRTEELEALAAEMYARGLSTRDIEAVFADTEGRSLLSRTAVSEITERLWAEYEAFATRDLAEFEVIYLFVDGIAERLHLGQPREAVLAAWGILADGKKALLHLAPGTKEDTASRKEFFHDELRPDVLGDLALQVSHLVRQAALANRARQAFLNRADHAGRPVARHQQRVGQTTPAPCHLPRPAHLSAGAVAFETRVNPVDALSPTSTSAPLGRGCCVRDQSESG